MQKKIDGKLTLDQLKEVLELHEQAGFLKLQSIAAQAGGNALVNVADFDEDDMGPQPPPLTLIEVLPAQNPASIIAAQQLQGKNLVDDATILVAGLQKKVLVFR